MMKIKPTISTILLITQMMIALPADLSWAAGVTINAGAEITSSAGATIATTGDWDNNGTFNAGGGTVILNGSISSILEPGTSSFNNLTINKIDASSANDNVTLQTDSLVVTGTTTITDGELIQGATNMTLNGMTIGTAGKYNHPGIGDLTLSADVVNDGVIVIDSLGVDDFIQIRSDVDGVQRDWHGLGTFYVADADVKDQTAIIGTPLFIHALSSTDNGNNINWFSGILTNPSVVPASLVANATSNHTLLFVTSGVIPEDGLIKIEYPAGFDVSGVGATATSTDIDGTLSVSVSGQYVTITRSGGTPFPAGGAVVDLTLTNIANPATLGLTGSFTISTYTPGSFLIDAGVADPVTISGGVIDPAALTLSGTQAGQTANHTINFTTSTNLPADGKIVLTYPATFDLSGVSLTVTSSTIDGTFSTSVSGQTLTITRSNDGTLESAGALDLVLTGAPGIQNPLTAGVTPPIPISTTDNTNAVLDAGTISGVTITSNILTDAAITPASLIRGATSSHTITFRTTTAIPVDGKITVTYPADFDLTSIGATATSTDIDGTLAVTVVGQVVTITRSGGTILGGASIVNDLVLTGIKNPPSAGLTASFSIATTDASDVTLDSGTAPGVPISGGVLSPVAISVSALLASAPADHTVSFTTTTDWPADGQLGIVYPVGFDLSGATLSSAGTVSGSLTLMIVGNKICLQRSGGAMIPGGTSVSGIVISGILNPPSAGQTADISVYTADNLGYPIDSGTATGPTIVAFVPTASTASFVNSANAPTPTFTVASLTTGKIYISLSDDDENTDSFTVETIQVTLTSPATGDAETIILTETGVDTGMFNVTVGITYDVDNTSSPANGILETRPEDVIAVNYTDDDDGADVSTATATIIAGNGLISLTTTANPELVTIGDLILWTATLKNETSETISDFDLEASIPSGLYFEVGSEKFNSGTYTIAMQDGGGLHVKSLSALEPNESRTLTFTTIVGANAKPGAYSSTMFARINPIISNTTITMIRVQADPVFHIGTLIGKVYWDKNENGFQDSGEKGIPGAVVATEQGYVITTDKFGRYHIPDFMSGRHMIKINPSSLPEGSRLTTANALIINQTDAMLTKANFGVQIPEEAAALIEAEQNSQVHLTVTKDPSSPQKVFGLEFHDVAPIDDTKRLEEISGSHYQTIINKNHLKSVLPFRMYTNYPKFIRSWKFEISRYKEKNTFEYAGPSALSRSRQSLIVAEQTGEPSGSSFKYTWDLPLVEKGQPILYEVRVTLEGADGKQDIAVYNLQVKETDLGFEWKLDALEKKESIVVAGSVVAVEGQTHANKVVSIFGQESLSGDDGKFSGSFIVPEGKQMIPVRIYLDDGKDPIEVSRNVDLKDSYFFFVGFGESEWGKMDIKGNMMSVGEEDRSKFQSSWYDETRLAYYLKGKIKGKYLITASIDTEREKRELFRTLEPEDYYPVYGDGSTLEADANDTQDAYFLMLEVDKSYFRYGNFNTGFTGTEFADFNRTLHGFKGHYESLSSAPDGKPVTFFTAFAAKARQAAARNEFASTGGTLYYLKHQSVVQGSEKITIVTRDKVSGISLSEKALVRGTDYDIDYDQGRLRFFHPVSLLSYDSNTILSTEILPGNPMFIVADYEHTSTDYYEDKTIGVRASQGLLWNTLRIGGTYVQESRSMERFGLQGLDGALHLPLETILSFETADSDLSATGQFISSDGGLSFTDITTPRVEGGGKAHKLEIETRPWKGAQVHGYYRIIDKGFTSAGTDKETGTEKYGVSLEQSLAEYGQVFVQHESQKILGLPIEATLGALASTSQDSETTTVQYKLVRDLWEATLEFRETKQVDENERLIGFEYVYHWTEKLKTIFGAQKSLVKDPNDQVRVGVVYDLNNKTSVYATQAVGNKGVGSLYGIDAGSGLFSYAKSSGILEEEKKIENTVDTDIGFSHKITKDTDVSVSEGLGTLKKRTFKFSRSTENGRTVEIIREEQGPISTTTYSESEEISPTMTRYNQNSILKDRRSNKTIRSETHGYKAKIWDGRGTLYQEEEFIRSDDANRQGQRTGLGIQLSEFDFLDLFYEQVQDTQEDSDTLARSGRVRYDYYDFDKLQIKNEWEVRFNRTTTDTLQLVSSGEALYSVNPEWAVYGRYEWSYTEDKALKQSFAKFGEFQTGVAYRPIENDKLNLLSEYKYLSDDAPRSQLTSASLAPSSGLRRHIARAEVAYDFIPQATFVEKVAMRYSEFGPSGSGLTRGSMTYLLAQRLTYHLNDRWDLTGEYRYTTQNLSNSSSHGYLLETTYRVIDSVWVALGYNKNNLDVSTSEDLGFQTVGYYVRLMVDPMEEITRFMNRSREAKKTPEKLKSS